ncbi:hypothetical protein [Leptospira saintgironsiae]|uniref:Lipoprotein n=1 Tax=Leptospira saintgironsiae TaxID=2023183 RepID=A0A2M9Y7B9_9LEPT|nr:hypothetical protein [Leptospira saintgironsiae]PJZ47480.1 hypothetical protein CH362_18980 [Leptospira saintgironsiae]
MSVYLKIVFLICFLMFSCKGKKAEVLNETNGQDKSLLTNANNAEIYGFAGDSFTDGALRGFLGLSKTEGHPYSCLELNETTKKGKFAFSDFRKNEVVEFSFEKNANSLYSMALNGKILYLRKYVEEGESRVFLTFNSKDAESESNIRSIKGDEKKITAYTDGSKHEDEDFDRCRWELQKQLEFQKEQETFGKEEAQRHKDAK